MRAALRVGLVVVLLGQMVLVEAALGQTEQDVKIDDYSQWKLALGSGQLAEPVAIATLPGFEVDLVRSAAPGEGSWISMAFDSRGRLLVGREDKGIWRLHFDSAGKTVARLEQINDTLLEPRGLVLAHGSLYVTANNSKGIYRLRDADGDDHFEQEELLRSLPGGVGHGRNGMALGPDGKIYVALGNNVQLPAEASARSPYRNGRLDRLLPCAWNEFLFDGDVQPPAGYIARMDADGREWEIVAGGFRNPYDLAFQRDGELFTFDADMEWDLGTPWYRPTCVMHVVPGGEYGWRQGTSVWPSAFADALPRVADIGLGSPTGVVFGEQSRFPAPYRDALFILDWAYGRILAVHLTPQGASYRGRVETFLKGKPLNVTDAAFGPDGAMYFLVGGRGTRSALYRVRSTAAAESSPPSTSEPVNDPDQQAAKLRKLRHSLEPAQCDAAAGSFETIWEALGSDDRFIRHAARTALERRELASWRELALGETEPTRALEALLALSRVGTASDCPALLKRVANWLGEPLAEGQRLTALRTIELALIRLGPASDEEQQVLRARLEPMFPSESAEENYLLTELLVALESSHGVAGALDLIPQAKSDSERLFYLFTLRLARQGWSLEMRRTFLQRLKEAEKFTGAHYMPRALTYLRTDALAGFSAEERQALAGEIDLLGRFVPATGETADMHRPEVRKWTMESLTAALAAIRRPADPVRGAKLYAEAQCVRCHRFGERGVPFGPDLTQVASRLSEYDLIDAVLRPARVVDEKYRTLMLENDEGQTVSGFLVGGDATSYFVAPDPLQPTVFRRIDRTSITSRSYSPLSPMPEGLFNTFTADEIFDLLAYCRGSLPAPTSK
jgi:putative heme-binding domain-containing protein